MKLWFYYKCMKILRLYLTLGKNKVKEVSSPNPEHYCSDCGEVVKFEQKIMSFPLDSKGIQFYIAVCTKCKTVYLHKSISIINL
jgi:hypothetical protein